LVEKLGIQETPAVHGATPVIKVVPTSVLGSSTPVYAINFDQLVHYI
jgi:hypothetical protein